MKVGDHFLVRYLKMVYSWVMTPHQKLMAMRALDSDLNLNPYWASEGTWRCGIPGEIGGDGLLRSISESANSPEKAVEKAWDVIEQMPLSSHLYVKGARYRWVGYMWERLS